MTYDHNCLATFVLISKGIGVERADEMLGVLRKCCLLTAEIILLDKINFDVSTI